MASVYDLKKASNIIEEFIPARDTCMNLESRYILDEDIYKVEALKEYYKFEELMNDLGDSLWDIISHIVIYRHTY